LNLPIDRRSRAPQKGTESHKCHWIATSELRVDRSRAAVLVQELMRYLFTRVHLLRASHDTLLRCGGSTLLVPSSFSQESIDAIVIL